MKIVLDTNVLVVSISKRSRFHPIWQAILHGQIVLLVTEEILKEYAEIIGQLMQPEVAEDVISGLEVLSNVVYVNRYYYWDLIRQDPDDNKFVDCAISGGASYIVTSDGHFKILKSIPFPKVEVIDPETFLLMVLRG